MMIKSRAATSNRIDSHHASFGLVFPDSLPNITIRAMSNRVFGNFFNISSKVGGFKFRSVINVGGNDC